MATLHTLTADTRMEDLPGLASGDTIALGGHVLTCESNLSAITGLYATGTGTIRLLDGANCDFSGSNPLPATVTIEGGTEDNPLPAHGEYGYPLRASASILLNSVYGDVVSHCIGNNARVQAAKVITATSSSVMLDRDMGLEAGDWIGVLIGRNQNTDPTTSPYPVGAWNPVTFTATCSPSPIPNAGSWVVLLTAGLHISQKIMQFSTGMYLEMRLD